MGPFNRPPDEYPPTSCGSSGRMKGFCLIRLDVKSPSSNACDQRRLHRQSFTLGSPEGCEHASAKYVETYSFDNLTVLV